MEFIKYTYEPTVGGLSACTYRVEGMAVFNAECVADDLFQTFQAQHVRKSSQLHDVQRVRDFTLPAVDVTQGEVNGGVGESATKNVFVFKAGLRTRYSTKKKFEQRLVSPDRHTD